MLPDDPQPYILTFDFNSICEAEQLTGLNLMKPLTGAGVTATETRGLLYAFLKPENLNLALSDVGGLLSRDIATVCHEVATFIREASGSEEPEPEPETEEPAKAK